MLVRELGDGRALCVGQASHAWMSGQVARAWGWPLDDPETIVLAATQHDIGMAAWDVEPALDPETGHPVAFTAMDVATHTRLWTRAPHLLESQSLHAALLVSHHGTGLYRRRPPTPAGDAYVASQLPLQERWAAQLGLDPAQVERERELIVAWDALSLALVLGWDPFTLPPIGGAEIERRGQTLDPWPFTADEVALRYEGRHLDAPCATEAELHAALAAAAPVSFELSLQPPSPPTT